MAGSGRLGTEMAAAFDIPPANVTTVLKALRSERVIRVAGRGSSALQMTPDDAIALIVGIASASATADVPGITRMLIEMPLRHSVRQGWGDMAIRFAPHVLVLPTPHTFKDGFHALFTEEWIDQSEREEMGEMGMFNPLDDIDAIRVTIGVNGHRTEGFAVIEARVTESKTLKNFYSTKARRRDVKKDEDPGGLGLSLYEPAPPFVFSAVLDGRALVTLAHVLAAPVAEARKRGHRRRARK
jgi:hypothetical protein